MKNNELGINEVRAFIFEIINKMSESEMRQLLEDLEKWQESKSDDKRRHPRQDIFITTDFADDKRVYRETIRNISLDGLFIETGMPLLMNQELTLTFSLPDSEIPVKVKGKIARIDSKGVGVTLYDKIPGI